MFGRCCLLTRPDNVFQEFLSRFQVDIALQFDKHAMYLLSLVDARIVDDISVTQMARSVYTVDHCDSESQAAIKIHKGRACNFVFMCSHALILSRLRNRIDSWF